MKPTTKGSLIALISLKVIIGTAFVYQMEPNQLFFNTVAIASEAELSRPVSPLEGKSDTSAESEAIDMSFLIEERDRLKSQEAEMRKRKEELMAIQSEIQEKLDEIAKLRQEILDKEAEEEALERRNMKHLIKAYAAMKPKQAADLINKLKLALSIELLSQMRSEEAGNILSYVDLDKAAKISEGLIGKK